MRDPADDMEPLRDIVVAVLTVLLVVSGYAYFTRDATYRSRLSPGASALQHMSAAAWDRIEEDERENGFIWAQSYDGHWYREWTLPGAEEQFERQWQSRLPD